MQQFHKYPNRRIYDPISSKYITLDRLLELIVAGISIRVEEAESGEDITQTTLLQILAKEERKQKSPLLTNLALEQLIRFTCNPYAQPASQFIEQSLEVVAQEGQNFFKSFERSAQTPYFNLFKTYTDLWSKD